MANESIENQYLRFKVDNEYYAIEIFKVREIIEPADITKIPKTPKYLLGVIDVRGDAVPVINMRSKLGLQPISHTIDTAIIILELPQLDETVQIGILVDSVQEVIELSKDELEAPPRFGTQLALEYIVGIGKKDEQFIVVIDIERILNSEERSFLSDAADMAVSGAPNAVKEKTAENSETAVQN